VGVLFVVSCFISTAMGTSVGTITLLIPIGVEVSVAAGCDAALCIGTVIGDGDDYYFNKKTGRFFREFEGREITLFDSFIDLLDDLYCWIEQCADGEYGDEWGEVYDEMFPEEE
jgi:hypothetical protein